MITEDYVSLDTSKLLKEKGFDVDECEVHYDPEDHTQYDITQQIAIKWLRETHNIGIFPSLFAFCVGEGGAAKPTYGTKIISLKSCELLTDDTNPMPTYKQACEAAIRYTLENLIN